MPVIDPDRGLRKDGRGNFIWETEDVEVETQHGTFTERRLVGQPRGGIQHRLGPGGISVYMYNDDPGVYLNERGAPVSDHFAAAAGFDVESLRRAKAKKAAMARMEAAVDEEFAGTTNQNIIAERGDYRLVEIAPGHFAIHFIEADGKGSPLSGSILTQKAAEKLFNELAPGEPNADNQLQHSAKPDQHKGH